jgi:hypothetical protein
MVFKRFSLKMGLFLYLINPLLHIDVFLRLFVPLEASNSEQNALFRLETLVFRIDFEKSDHFFGAILYQMETKRGSRF